MPGFSSCTFTKVFFHLGPSNHDQTLPNHLMQIFVEGENGRPCTQPGVQPASHGQHLALLLLLVVLHEQTSHLGDTDWAPEDVSHQPLNSDCTTSSCSFEAAIYIGVTPCSLALSAFAPRQGVCEF